jgi:hypothetical protein
LGAAAFICGPYLLTPVFFEAPSIFDYSAYVEWAGLRGASSHIDPGAYKFRMGAVPV